MGKSILPRNISSNIRVIHNGIDTERFSPERRNSNEFKFLGEITKPKVLYAGRLLALKSVDTLLKSIKHVLKKCDAYFLLVGTGDIDKWKRLLYGIPENNYKFLGYVDYERINYLYAKVNLFVLPSFTESFPLVILEAMASGVLVIATNVGGIPEIIENHEDGILIEPNNPKILADTITTLLRNPTQRKTISKTAREKVMNNFTSRVMVEKTKKYYEEIILGGI